MNKNHTRFYLLLTITLLLFVLIGFSRTFYLRSFFEQPERWQLDQLPSVYVIHGMVLTAWFLLLVMQSAVINLRKVSIHRKLGFAMAGLAILVVFTGIQVVLDSTPRSIRMGLLDPESISEMRGQSFPLFLDLFSLVVFTAAMAVALVFRKNPVLHRTSVLTGSFAFMVVALARATAFVFPSSGLGLLVALFFLLPILLVVHDWVKFKRFPKYAFIGLMVLLLMVVFAFVIPQTDWGYRFFVNYLSGLSK
ncbi:hypothetical protein [Pararhodonellum marinum]|uniref:hypothetical protein n=1 Tax=Pararhodonellum marinum TaxID=2755358 RepID=UPI00188E0578|nr:hypothetical protein [Pararhodonellum marinum]